MNNQKYMQRQLYFQEYYRRHRKEKNSYSKRWKKEHPELSRAINRRAEEKNRTHRFKRSSGSKTATISYQGMHTALKKHRGPAANHNCVICGTPANHWALNHESPNLIVDVHSCRAGSVFSMFYGDYYPKCQVHNLADGSPVAEGWSQKLVERGMTSFPFVEGKDMKLARYS